MSVKNGSQTHVSSPLKSLFFACSRFFFFSPNLHHARQKRKEKPVIKTVLTLLSSYRAKSLFFFRSSNLIARSQIITRPVRTERSIEKNVSMLRSPFSYSFKNSKNGFNLNEIQYPRMMILPRTNEEGLTVPDLRMQCAYTEIRIKRRLILAMIHYS